MANADFSRIATNIGALNALNSLNSINKNLGIHQQRLATGKRINSAADDPAGLTIATKLNARAEGLKVAGDNIADAQNLLSVAESGLGRINDILVQMRNKSEQAASDTIGKEEREAILTQLNAYTNQIQDLVDQTTWNDNQLLGDNSDGVKTQVGTSGASLRFQTGADKADATVLDTLTDVGVANLGFVKTATTDISKVATAGLSVAAALGTAAQSNTNLSNLTDGVYTVKISFGAAATNDMTVELFDSSGNALYVDADNDGTTEAIDKSVKLAANADTTIDFGNGLTFDFKTADFSASGEASGTWSVQSGAVVGGYELTYDGAAALTSASSAEDFADFMEKVDSAMGKVSGQLSEVGALAGRLTFKAEQVSVMQVNVESSYNRIMNADMAFEQLEATKYSILQQTSTTMLAQANTAPQGILSLFR